MEIGALDAKGAGKKVVKMDNEKLDELWKHVQHIGKVECLGYDAMVVLGSIFGQMKSEIERLKQHSFMLERTLMDVREENEHLKR